MRAQNRRGEAFGLLQCVYGSFIEGFDTRDMQEAAGLLAELS